MDGKRQEPKTVAKVVTVPWGEGREGKGGHPNAQAQLYGKNNNYNNNCLITYYYTFAFWHNIAAFIYASLSDWTPRYQIITLFYLGRNFASATGEYSSSPPLHLLQFDNKKKN